MDAFFAAVEQRDNPDYRGKPIAVGGDGPRSVVSTASYEARRFGVRSAMPVMAAKRLCPELIMVDSHFDRYKEVSRQVHSIFSEYTDIIEPISLDEAFLDVTQNKKNMPLAMDIANEIRARIRSELRLTASAGVSYNKLLAKIASDRNKPDGIFIIHPERAQDFIAGLRIEDFWGVGPRTAERMHRIGVFNGAQLRDCSLQHLTDVFGKAGYMYYNFARGIDERPVETDWVRKSVGCEHTFLTDLNTSSAVTIELYHVVMELVERIKKSGFSGRTLTLKVKYADFTQLTRSVTQGKMLYAKTDILPLAKRLLKQLGTERRSIRLMGLSVSNPQSGHLPHNSYPEWVEGYLEFSDQNE